MLLLLETMTLKDGLDLFQSFGLGSSLAWLFRQYLSFRDLKNEVKLLKEWKAELAQAKKEEAEKQEEKEAKREAVQQEILTTLQDLKFKVEALQNAA